MRAEIYDFQSLKNTRFSSFLKYFFYFMEKKLEYAFV